MISSIVAIQNSQFFYRSMIYKKFRKKLITYCILHMFINIYQSLIYNAKTMNYPNYLLKLIFLVAMYFNLIGISFWFYPSDPAKSTS